MSKKRKSQPSEITEVKSEKLVPYQVFFNECLHRGMVDPWQEKEIHAFFRDLGLTDKESSDTYKIALAKY